MVVMFTKTAITIALQTWNNTRYFGESDVYGPLVGLLRPPHYEHEVRYPIEHATAGENEVLPSEAATQWLRDCHRHGEIGPWDCTLLNDFRMPRRRLSDMTFVDLTDMAIENIAVTNMFYVVVSFLNIEDAALFRLKWMPAR